MGNSEIFGEKLSGKTSSPYIFADIYLRHFSPTASSQSQPQLAEFRRYFLHSFCIPSAFTRWCGRFGNVTVYEFQNIAADK